MVIVGIDEAGRGPCAGPLVAVAVVLGQPITDLNDSKALTVSNRQALAQTIRRQALSIGIGWVSAAQIDTHGLSWAQTTSMGQALSQISLKPDKIIIDGKHNYLKHIAKTEAIIKADQSQPAVMAASIIAKVARDNFMDSLDQLYPNYGFGKHKGYCTADHLAMIKKHQPLTAIHRFSYQPVAEVASL